MAFEEKYNRYKKSERFAPPDGYVDDIAGRVSEKISERRTVPAFRVWSLSLSAVAVLALGWFLYPTFVPATQPGQPAMAQAGAAEQSLAQLTVPVIDSNPWFAEEDDTSTFASMALKTEKTPSNEVLTLNDVSNEEIMEYLLDEDFEEI